MSTLGFRLRIRNAADTADDIVVTSMAGGQNPYIAEGGLPEGEGQTLSPVTGEVTTGSYTVGVIDAVDEIAVEELVASDGFECAEAAAMESGGWTITDTMDVGNWAVGAVDQAYAGSRSLKGIVNGWPSGSLRAQRTFGPADGIQPLTFYTVRIRARMSSRAWFDTDTRLWVNGVSGDHAAVTTAGEWQELVQTGTSNADGELVIMLQRTASYPAPQDFSFWFDALAINTYLTGEDRIITSRLADATGKQQLLSRRAYLEETEDEGDTFDVLVAGYLTALELTTALRFTCTVGESRRVEQTVRVFEVAEAGFDRVSCPVGGPIIGDFADYTDRGRPRFTKTGATGDVVILKWSGGHIYGPLLEEHPPLEDRNREFVNALARPYLGEAPTPSSPYPFHDLRVRLFAIDTGAGVVENYPSGITQDFMPVAVRAADLTLPKDTSGLGLFGLNGEIALYWPDDPSYPARPANGTRFKLAIFPRTISEHNPLHWRGHPMDLATGLLALRGFTYDATSADDVKAELGGIEVELRITQGMTLAAALEQLVYGPFGIAARTNTAGALEFFTTRRRAASTPVATITLNSLRDVSPPVWRIEEGSAVNKVTYKLRAFNPVGTVRQAGAPIDYLSEAVVPIEAVPNASDYEVYGDRSITYDLPGRLLNTEPVDFVAGQASEIFEERGRGAIISDLACLRGTVDALIGQEVVLDLPHLPTANPTQSPVSQRGTTPRVALVLRRTQTPGGPNLLVQDRGIALSAPLTPEFTVAASVADDRKIATVEITNGAALEAEDVAVRVEWAVSPTTPSVSRLLKVLDPASDALTFDLPAVNAGSRVWVRMRTEYPGRRAGAWSAFENVQLDALDVPTSFAGTVAGGYVDLTWVAGANAADIPVEVLLREDGETTWESAALLPAGSIQYRLAFPDPEQAYDVGVRHRESAPFAGVSSIATLELTSEPIETLSAPINPAAFADGAGTFGVEVTATAFPSGVEVAVAVETAVGSGTAGAYETIGSVVSVQSGRTRFTNPTIAANDGKRRYLKARHTREGATASAYTSEVSVLPWAIVAPHNPEPDPEPDPSHATSTIVIPLHKGATVPIGLRSVGAVITPLTTGRGAQTKFPLDQYQAIRLVAEVVHSTLPVGAVLAAEFEAAEAVGIWASIDGAGGPIIPVDPDSLDALDENPDETAWVVSGEWVAIREEALADVRIRGVIAGGDDSGEIIVSGLELQVRSLPVDVTPPETESPPEFDPGSCETPGDLDAFAYADLAALDVAWSEDP